MKPYIEPPLTIADIESMPDDGNRYEVIEGELFVSTAPTIFHQKIVTRIIVAFWLYLRDHPIGEILPGPGIVFDDFSGVIPDLCLLHSRKGKADRGRWAPDRGA